MELLAILKGFQFAYENAGSAQKYTKKELLKDTLQTKNHEYIFLMKPYIS